MNSKHGRSKALLAEKIFTECSQYMLVPLFCGWLDVVDLGRLDSSLCHESIRPLFLELLSSDIAIFYGIESESKVAKLMKLPKGKSSHCSRYKIYVSWLQKRQVSVFYFCFLGSDCVSKSHILRFNGKMKFCTNLRHLICSCQSVESILRKILKAISLPHLEQLTFSCLRVSSSECKVSPHCKKGITGFNHSQLKELNLKYVSIYPSQFKFLFDKCVNLVKFSSCELKVSGSVVCCDSDEEESDYYFDSQEMQQYHKDTDLYVSHLIANNPSLTCVNLNEMCTGVLLTAVITHCKQLTELRCEESKHLSYGPWLSDIFTNLPLLRTWSTIGLHNDDIVLPVSSTGARPLTHLNISKTLVLNNTLIISMIRCYPHLQILHIGFENPYLSY